jgi:hypothetical protein
MSVSPWYSVYQEKWNYKYNSIIVTQKCGTRTAIDTIFQFYDTTQPDNSVGEIIIFASMYPIPRSESPIDKFTINSQEYTAGQSKILPPPFPPDAYTYKFF